MKSLIRKEVRQQLVWLLVALSLATQLWFAMGNVWEQLVLPGSNMALWSLAYPLLYAFALAQLQFGRDGDTRHFGLLVHRGHGVRGYFASKVIVGVGLLACVVVLPVTIWALVKSFSDPDRALIGWVRIPQACTICVPVLIAYAMGVLGTQLRRGALLRWAVALGGALGAFLIAWPLTVLLAPGWIMWVVWIVLDVLLAGGVLWLARSLLLRGSDRDLPLRDRQLCGFAAVVFLVLLPFGSFLLGSAGSAALNEIVGSKPAVLFDSESAELVVARRALDGWQRLEVPNWTPGARTLTQSWGNLFTDEQGRALDLVHHAGSTTVEGAEEARESLKALSRRRSIADPAPRPERNEGIVAVAPRAAGGRAAELGENWTVQFELDAQDGTIHLAASRVRDGLPPLEAKVARPGGRFSAEAGFLGFRHHAPVVLDRADGTLWRIRLAQEGAIATPIELPDGDRVVDIEPLFRRNAALFGRFEQQHFDSLDRRSGCAFVGRLGTYVLADERIVPFREAPWTEDTVTYEEARKLAQFAVTSTWPDAFTEEIRVERLADHAIVFECSAGLETSGARTAAAIYGGMAFLRGPAGVLGERLGAWSADSGFASAPFAKEKRLFTDGRHPLLFALVMLGGAFQLFLGWRWMARGGAGTGTRIVYLLLIATGGVVALIFTRLLLPRVPRGAAAGAPVRRESVAPVPA